MLHCGITLFEGSYADAHLFCPPNRMKILLANHGAEGARALAEAAMGKGRHNPHAATDVIRTSEGTGV
jgi:hypothetical protein